MLDRASYAVIGSFFFFFSRPGAEFLIRNGFNEVNYSHLINDLECVISVTPVLIVSHTLF